MQFIPSTRSIVAVDAADDAQRNPEAIDDAALGAAVYLCSGAEDLGTDRGVDVAVYRYSRSAAYVALVKGIARDYAAGSCASGLCAEPLAVLGGEDLHPARREPVDLALDDDSATTAVHLDVAGAALLQQVDEVLEVLDVPALVRRDRDALHVLLEPRVDDLLHRAVVAEMDDFSAL